MNPNSANWTKTIGSKHTTPDGNEFRLPSKSIHTEIKKDLTSD